MIDFVLKDINIFTIIQSVIKRKDQTRKKVSNQEESPVFTDNAAIFSKKATNHHAKNKREVIRRVLSFVGEKKLYPSGISINTSVIRLKKIILKCQKISQKSVRIIAILIHVVSFSFFMFF
jgi:hypothetical protein